jgi:hypothetical protein
VRKLDSKDYLPMILLSRACAYWLSSAMNSCATCRLNAMLWEPRPRARDQLFSSRFSSLKKRQSVPCAMIVLGAVKS